MVTQATSPVFTSKAFWCIEKTMREAGFNTLPYHTYVPTFGDWGWVMGTMLPLDIVKKRLSTADLSRLSLRYLNKELLQSIFLFSPADMIDSSTVEVHSDFDPVLYRYYQEGKWFD